MQYTLADLDSIFTDPQNNIEQLEMDMPTELPLPMDSQPLEMMESQGNQMETEPQDMLIDPIIDTDMILDHEMVNPHDIEILDIDDIDDITDLADPQ